MSKPPYRLWTSRNGRSKASQPIDRSVFGLSVYDAAMDAARQRFRPIIMTSLAFILGVVPLAVSSGAGSASRHSIGTGVIGGMLAATFLAILFVPMFFKLATRERNAGDTAMSTETSGTG